MKRIFLFSLFSVAFFNARADELTYAATLKAARERLHFLEAERADYRKPKPSLPSAQAEERLRLLGQLFTDDPIWTLSQQVEADILAIIALRPHLPADITTIDALKELLAIIGGFEERATTRAQAEQFAFALRQFVTRRDVLGASTWAKSQ